LGEVGFRGDDMSKKAVIEILLVPESAAEQSKRIEKEILKEFRKHFLTIPWFYEIKKVKVTEA
jgi:hypothetical protein